MDVVLSIAGSDSSAGAGIQADIKTIAAQGAYGVTAITAVTAQNQRGVQAIEAVSPDLLETQLQSLLDTFGGFSAVKIGMLPTPRHATVVAGFVAALRDTPVVVDPVRMASTGEPLQEEATVDVMRGLLLPAATVVTPNVDELHALVGGKDADMGIEQSARKLREQGCGAVVVTGGDQAGGEAVDVLVHADGVQEFRGPRIETHQTHGTGCTFSSALACSLARGTDLPRAVAEAKSFVSEVLRHPVRFSADQGAMDHLQSMHVPDEPRFMAPARSGRTVGEVRG